MGERKQNLGQDDGSLYRYIRQAAWTQDVIFLIFSLFRDPYDALLPAIENKKLAKG